MRASNAILNINPWNPGGSFMVQKMAISSPIPVFKGLKEIAFYRGGCPSQCLLSDGEHIDDQATGTRVARHPPQVSDSSSC